MDARTTPRSSRSAPQCVADQYAQYTVVDDIKINSKLTLGEDVADLGGTLLAYMAWKDAVAGPGRSRPVDGLTPDQRFFVGIAQWACENERPENKRVNAITNPHSPDEYRINGVVVEHAGVRGGLLLQGGPAHGEGAGQGLPRLVKGGRRGPATDDEGERRLERLLAIALLLSARRRLRAEDLARRFGTSLRTVYRDMRALQQAGFPVSGTAGDGYTLPPGSHLRPLALGPDEAEALVMGARLLERVADAGLRESLRAATAKLEAVLAPEAVRRLRDHETTVLMPPVRSRAPGPLTLLLRAVQERRVVDIAYSGVARGEATRRAIEPLGLVRFAEYWLVPAYCRLRQDLRVFRADRMSEARATGETFTLRPGLTLEDFVRLKEQEAPPAPVRSS